MNQEMKPQLNPKRCAQVTGRVFAQPALRYTPNGKAVCSLTVGLSNGKDEKTGKWRDNTFTEWTAWDALAEEVAQLQKGQYISVQGNIKSESWIDKMTKQKRTKLAFTLINYSIHDSVDASQNG